MMAIKSSADDGIGALKRNSRYTRWDRIRGKVTRIGEHGTRNSSWGERHMSDRASYVESEVVEDESAARCGYTYQHLIVSDLAYPATGCERTPSRYGSDDKDKILKVNRCMGAHVISTWTDHLAAVTEHEKYEVEAERVRNQNEFEANDIRRRFKNLGLVARGHNDCRFELDTQNALVILHDLEKFRGATTRP